MKTTTIMLLKVQNFKNATSTLHITSLTIKSTIYNNNSYEYTFKTMVEIFTRIKKEHENLAEISYDYFYVYLISISQLF